MDNNSSGSSEGSFRQDARDALDKVLREKQPLSGKVDIHQDPGVNIKPEFNSSASKKQRVTLIP